MNWQDQLEDAREHLSAVDPKLHNLIVAYGNCTLQLHTDYYKGLVSSIVGQQLSVKAAAAIRGRLMALFDNHTPSPEELLNTPSEILRAVGLSNAKVVYVKDLAQHIVDGRLDLAHITTLPNNDVIRELVAVKGIGEWSAHMFMIFSLGRTNILPTGDLGIRKAMRDLYGLKALPNPAQMLKISLQNKWSPYQSIAAWYLWKSLEKQT